MTAKLLLEQIAESENALQSAEHLYKTVPSAMSSVRYIEALEKYDRLNDILESIIIEVEDSPQEKKPSLNKRKRNGYVSVLKNNKHRNV